MSKNNQRPKRPWSIQKDGDLWHTFCEIMAKQKGRESIRISEVKGHVTEEKIKDGTATNDKADKYADEGVKGHTEELVKISGALAKRQNKYVELVKNIHDHILEALYTRTYLQCRW